MTPHSSGAPCRVQRRRAVFHLLDGLAQAHHGAAVHLAPTLASARLVAVEPFELVLRPLAWPDDPPRSRRPVEVSISTPGRRFTFTSRLVAVDGRGNWRMALPAEVETTELRRSARWGRDRLAAVRFHPVGGPHDGLRLADLCDEGLALYDDDSALAVHRGSRMDGWLSLPGAAPVDARVAVCGVRPAPLDPYATVVGARFEGRPGSEALLARLLGEPDNAVR
jgi:hypothetical protein